MNKAHNEEERSIPNKLPNSSSCQRNEVSENVPIKNCLSTCCIYLSGIYGARLEKYKAVIQQLGGVFSERLTPQVTHFVSDTYVEK
jgi:hypothetical protein